MAVSMKKLIKKNFIEKVSYVPRHNKNMNVLKTNNFIRVNSRLPSDTFNVSVILNNKIEGLELQNEIIDYYEIRNYPMAVWDWDNSNAIKEVIEQGNLTLAEVNIGMFACTSELKIENITPNNFFIKPVVDSSILKEIGDVLASFFGESLEAMYIRKYYDILSETSLYIDSPLKLYLGYVDNKPICTGSVIFTKDSVGIYDIATLEEYRKKGFGTAMFNFILKDIQKRYNGICVLQSSEDGLQIYKRAGFSSTCKVLVYENSYLVK